MKEKILQLKSEGRSIRQIAKELDVPLHQVRNTIYRNSESKTESKPEKEVQSMIKEAKKIISSAKEGLAPININNALAGEFIDLKSIAYFDKIAEHIERIDQADKRIGKLQILIDTLENRLQSGNFLDKDERGTISTLIRLYERISDDTKNNSTNIKEILISISGSIKEGLIPKQVEPAQISQEDKDIESLGMVKLKGIF